MQNDYNFIVDSHCHLNMLSKERIQIKNIIDESNSHNISFIQTICTKKSDVLDIIKIITLNKKIFGSIGIHPLNAEKGEYMSCEEIIDTFLLSNKLIGIGETGLDYYKNLNEIKPIKNQKDSFLEHIKAAQKLQKPLIIHCRNAQKDIIDMTSSEMRKKNFNSLIHCFHGDRKFAAKALDLSMYISISGIITFKNAYQLREVVKFLPLDKILVETDSPYLSPHPFRGKTNQPHLLRYTVEQIAKIKKKSFNCIAKATSKNFFKLFGLTNKICNYINK